MMGMTRRMMRMTRMAKNIQPRNATMGKHKAGSPKVRQYHGETKPELIEKAIEALTSKYPIGVDEDDNEIWEEPCSPTSVELKENHAVVWFEYFAEDAAEGEMGFDWSYSMSVPLYYFWGRKKREKYLKEQRKPLIEKKNYG